MNKTFKEQVDADIHGVFLNPAEFAAPMDIDGEIINAVFDEAVNTLHLGSNMGMGDTGSYLLNEGICTVYCKLSDLGYRPEPGARMHINGKLWEVTDDSHVEEGMLIFHVMSADPR